MNPDQLCSMKGYYKGDIDTWEKLSIQLVTEVCGGLVTSKELKEIKQLIIDKKFIPAGRYLYYAGRDAKFYNNCFMLKAEEDTREEWGNLVNRVLSCLMVGGGVGINYDVIRAKGSILGRTGGTASGVLALMELIDFVGSKVQQGGSRRSALFGSLKWNHLEIPEFLNSKNWSKEILDHKLADYNFKAPLDCTNISVGYDANWLWESEDKDSQAWKVFRENVRLALLNGEPGFSFNLVNPFENLRNAPVAGCTNVLTSKGYKKVIDIIDTPSTIWTGYNWSSNVIFKKTKSNTKTVKVSFSGGRNIICDPEHEFFTIDYLYRGRSKRIIEKKQKAKNLVVGQKLKVSLPLMNKAISMSAYQYILGFCYGDGSFTNSGVDLSFFEESKFNAVSPLIHNMEHVVYNDKRAIKRYFLKIDCPESKKSLPPFDTDVDKASFIAGYFDADGNYNESRGCPLFRLSSARYSILVEIRRLLEELGILSNISVGSNSSFKKENKTWTLSILSSYTILFSQLIPTRRLKISSKYKEYVPYRESTIKVESVKDSEKQDVYCCNVKLEEHSFQAEGIIISNCCEVTSSDDSDVCNLGSINLARVESLYDFQNSIRLATLFLLCGSIRAELPTAKVEAVRAKNNRIGIGLMGVHEFQIQRGRKYAETEELEEVLYYYKKESDKFKVVHANKLKCTVPVACRAVAPTGTISMLAETTSGIEPIFAKAYKRRYLKEDSWHYSYVIDSTAYRMQQKYDAEIESAHEISIEDRLKMISLLENYVDQGVSSTINLAAPIVDEQEIDRVAEMIRYEVKMNSDIRGLTFYPNGARGNVLEEVDIVQALANRDVEFKEHDICDISKKSTCG
uniref:Putative ribonucleoside diphosphate reductase n=2 Tax=viral metagenome TaxID=1070528 RepID=A0A6H1ZLW5_9ZZZZ